MRSEINLRALNDTIDQILADPARGALVWKASAEWAGGLRVQTKCRQFDLAFDEPPNVAGTDTAPGPHEAVLACYGACLIATFALRPTDQVPACVFGAGMWTFRNTGTNFRDLAGDPKAMARAYLDGQK